MRKFFKNNGLSIVMLGLFLVTLIGQVFAGHRAYNEEQREHGESPIGTGEYLRTGHFWEAVGENWESEFLQMGCFVILTVFLFREGSAGSKDPDEPDQVDADPAFSRDDPVAAGAVRRGGFALLLYSHALSLAFLALFLVSFVMHAVGGLGQYDEE